MKLKIAVAAACLFSLNANAETEVVICKIWNTAQPEELADVACMKRQSDFKNDSEAEAWCIQNMKNYDNEQGSRNYEMVYGKDTQLEYELEEDEDSICLSSN